VTRLSLALSFLTVAAASAILTPLDGERMTALRDIVAYMDTICPGRQNRLAWRYAAGLLLDAAERNGSLVAVRSQVMTALLLDGKLDIAATVPADAGA
jgi:hypothetical protein